MRVLVKGSVGGPAQSFARSTYDPSAVMITTRVPAVIWGGTMVRTPLDSVAGKDARRPGDDEGAHHWRCDDRHVGGIGRDTKSE